MEKVDSPFGTYYVPEDGEVVRFKIGTENVEIIKCSDYLNVRSSMNTLVITPEAANSIKIKTLKY